MTGFAKPPDRTIAVVAIVAWITALLAVSGRVLVTPQRNSVYTIYAAAAQRWLAGESLGTIGTGHGDPYRYGPSFIPIILPFAVLPDCLGGVLWRIGCAGLLLIACGWFFRAVQRKYSVDRGAISWFWLVLLPLSLGNINNGQANVLLAALIAATAAAVLDERWNVAALCAALCCVIKLYPLVLAAMLVVLFTRRFTGRFLLATAGLLLLPYAMQSSAYVTQQYIDWMHSLTLPDCRRDALVIHARRDLRLVLRLIDPGLAGNLCNALSAGLAALVACLCLAYRSQRNRGDHISRLLFLGVCWMLLCGPATESATYILLAPFLLWRLADLFSRPAAPMTWTIVLTAVGGMIVYNAACWFPSGRSLIFALQPIATLALFLEGACGLLMPGLGITWSGIMFPSQSR